MTSEDQPSELAPLDALLLKGDAEPSTRAVLTGVLVLDRLPAADRLRAAFDAATHAVPRMRQRVVTSTPLRPPVWVTDDHVDLEYHLRHIGVGGDGSLSAALRIASAGFTAPLDPARPLWEAIVVEGLEGGRAVVLLRAHHAVADGIRALQMLAGLLDLEPAPRDTAPLSRAVTSAAESRTAHPLLRAPWNAAQTASQRALTASKVAWRLTLRPTEMLADGAEYVGSLGRLFSTSGAVPSEALRGRSRSRRLAVLEVPLDDLRGSAKAAECTVNDAYLAALLGGFRLYHEALGVPFEDLPLALPIGRYDVSASAGGNHFDAAVLNGPASVVDPAVRMRLVHEAVAARRAEPGVDAVTRLAPVLQQLPPRLAIGGLSAHGRRVDLQASNLIGPPVPTYLAGARVERIYAFGPLPRVPVMAVLVSYDGVCSIGVTLDPAAVTEPDLFIDCVRQGFDEVLDGRAVASVVVPPV